MPGRIRQWQALCCLSLVLASFLFLQSGSRRGVLVVAIIPLGLIRNGLRILTSALLCVHVGPYMINSPIQRRGGPIFFAASLLPLFLLPCWLRHGEVVREQRKALEETAKDSIFVDAPAI